MPACRSHAETSAGRNRVDVISQESAFSVYEVQSNHAGGAAATHAQEIALDREALEGEKFVISLSAEQPGLCRLNCCRLGVGALRTLFSAAAAGAAREQLLSIEFLPLHGCVGLLLAVGEDAQHGLVGLGADFAHLVHPLLE